MAEAIGAAQAAPTGTRRLRSLASPAAIHAMKVALTVVLSMAVAFLFNLGHTFWAMMTVPLIVRPEAGTMVWRSVARFAGTLAGTLAAITFIACFAQVGPQMIAALAVFVFIVGYLARMQSGMDAYAYGTAGFTALTIAIDTGADASQGYALALSRTTETLIPILCGFIVMLVVFPRSVSREAEAKLARARDMVLGFTREVLAHAHGPGAAPEKAVIATIGAAHQDLRSLTYERSRKDWGRPRMARVARAMDQAVIRATALRFSQETLGAEARADPAVRATRQALEALTDRILAAGGTDVPALLDAAEMSDALAARVEAGLATRDAAPLPTTAMLLQLRELALGLGDLARAEALLADPALARPRTGPLPDLPPAARRYRDHLAGIQNGLRPAIVLVVLSTIWFGTGWSNGSVLTLIGSALTLLLPTIVPRPALVMAGKAIAIGMAAGAVIALALMLTLAQVEGFAAFALLIGSAVGVIFYLCGEVRTLPLAIGAMIVISIGLQPTNSQSYSPLSLFNTVATLALLPVTFISAMTILFPENRDWLAAHLARGTTRLLDRMAGPRPMQSADFFDETIDMFTDYAAGLDLATPRDEQLVRRTRAALVAGLACDGLRQMETDPALPPALAAYGPALRAELTPALRRPARTKAEAATGAAPYAGLQATFASLAPTAPSPLAQRYLARAEQLRALIASGALALPPRPGSPA